MSDDAIMVKKGAPIEQWIDALREMNHDYTMKPSSSAPHGLTQGYAVEGAQHVVFGAEGPRVDALLTKRPKQHKLHWDGIPCVVFEWADKRSKDVLLAVFVEMEPAGQEFGLYAMDYGLVLGTGDEGRDDAFDLLGFIV